ncbi:hypothetical protein WMY93_012761 [Mugilogobius chulae]|uniref:Myosin motor domain-containing protein n=1 Tax=Mugilogobius chulae TaxID=88201 RepID=A0AAW0P1V5_9GOBI
MWSETRRMGSEDVYSYINLFANVNTKTDLDLDWRHCVPGAFGNAKTAHNNNSSRFGKFIQVNYQESGTVRGAYVEKYLLEKSRLVYQEHNERNYHVFYYLLAGASEDERTAFHLMKPEEYHYLSQMTKKPHRSHWDSYSDSEPDCFTVEGEDLKHDFERLQLAMEMVGFLPKTRKTVSPTLCSAAIFSLLSAILHLGNIRYKRKTYRDDSIDICNPEVLPIVSELLEVKEETLFEALTTRKTVTVGEKLIVPYKLSEAGTVRDSMAKSLYSALFDWIVFRINHALLNIKDLEETTKILSIGVLDIFGFEDYENNSFEQFCINFANERLQHYFNQHIFKLEQDFREKNTDHMRPDIVALLKSSKNAFICGLIGIDPPATFRWAVLRAYFRALVAFREAGKRHAQKKPGHDDAAPCAVLKSVDSFSFLQHPVHQRSLEILQRCKEEKYTPDDSEVVDETENGVTRKSPRTPLSDLQGSNINDKSPRGSPALGWNGRVGRQSRLSSSSSTAEDEIFVNSTSSKLLERAHDILMRNKNYKPKPALPKHLLNVKSLKYLSNLTLHDRITKSLLHLHKKKKPPSISAQFQASLNKLMETLGQSEPYFVKCIRSNAEKDFVQHFRVLLPEGTSPSKECIQKCLQHLSLSSDGFQDFYTQLGAWLWRLCSSSTTPILTLTSQVTGSYKFEQMFEAEEQTEIYFWCKREPWSSHTQPVQGKKLQPLFRDTKLTSSSWIHTVDEEKANLFLRSCHSSAFSTDSEQSCSRHSPAPDTVLLQTQSCSGHSPAPITVLLQIKSFCYIFCSESVLKLRPLSPIEEAKVQKKLVLNRS